MSDRTEQAEQLDDIHQLEAPPETANALPKGWLVLFWGLVVFGVFYVWRYSPALGGWAQSHDLEGGGGADAGANIFATIAFTAIPTAAAIWLIVAQRAKRRGAAGR